MAAKAKLKQLMRHPDRTRALILEAAKKAFASRGFDNTGLREIAAAAGISLALVNRYFGSKENLFEIAFDSLLDMTDILSVDHAHFGAHVMELCLQESAPPQFSMVLLSASHRNALEASAKLVKTRVIDPLARWLGPPKAEERAMKIQILCQGLYTAFYFMPVHRSHDARSRVLRQWYANMIQGIVDEGKH